MSGKLYAKLDDYQKHAVRWSMKRGSAGLFFEQGTGKTWITGGVIEAMWDKAFCGLIVVSLANIHTTWFKFLRAHFVNVCETLEEFDEAQAPKLLVLHYESLSPTKKKDKHGKRTGKNDWGFVQEIAKRKWSLIVYDESQRLKERTSLQSKAAERLRASAERKVILSGTPVESSPKDLWAQFRFLAPEVFGTRWQDFEDEYFEDDEIDLSKYRRGSFMFKKMLRMRMMNRRKRPFDQDMMPQFLRKIKPYALRVTKEVLNLPPLNVIPFPVTLRGKQRTIYEAVERDMVSLVDRSVVSTPLKITQIGKMHQICGGYVFDDDGEIHEVGRAKLRATLRLIRDNVQPIVIFCRYREEVWALHDEVVDLGLRVETLTGKTKKGLHRAKIQEDFQAGKTDVLICQVKTGGVGIDLFRSCTAIFFSLTYSFIDFEQAISRLHRRGQENTVNIFLVYAVGTIDEAIQEAIVTKRKVTEIVLNHLKEKPHGKGSEVRRAVSVQEARHPGRVRARAAAQQEDQEERRRRILVGLRKGSGRRRREAA